MARTRRRWWGLADRRWQCTYCGAYGHGSPDTAAANGHEMGIAVRRFVYAQVAAMPPRQRQDARWLMSPEWAAVLGDLMDPQPPHLAGQRPVSMMLAGFLVTITPTAGRPELQAVRAGRGLG